MTERTRPSRRDAAFTLIELMVVIAIIVMAAGLMIPSITDFFKNRELDGVRQQITAALGSARLQAVSNNRPFVVVFFREGVRTYDVKRRTWMDGDEFDPATAPAASEEIHVDLTFADMHNDCAFIHGAQGCIHAAQHANCVPGGTCTAPQDVLPRYDDWWWMVSHGQVPEGTAAPEMSTAAEKAAAEAAKGQGLARFPMDGLVGIRFERDGTMTTVVPTSAYTYDPGAAKGDNPDQPDYHPPVSVRVLEKKGNDVPLALYKKDPPEGADIIIWQRGNAYACFIDLQRTGAVHSRVAPTTRLLKPGGGM